MNVCIQLIKDHLIYGLHGYSFVSFISLVDPLWRGEGVGDGRGCKVLGTFFLVEVFLMDLTDGVRVSGLFTIISLLFYIIKE